MGNEIFNELIASLIVGFMTVCFSVFPKYRGFMFIILTIFIGAWAIIAEMKYKAFIWGGAIVVMPLIFSMMYFIFSGMNRAYSLSLLCGLIVSTVIIWLMAVGVICYEIGLVTADNNSGRIVASDDEAVMKIQGEFDAYKENANKIIADLGQKISDLQKGLDTEKAGREDAENRLYLQVSIHSEDIKRLSNVEIEAKTKQDKMFLALGNIQSRFDHYKESADKIIAELQTQLDNEKARNSEIEERLSVQISIHSEDIKRINSAKAEYDRALRTLFFGNNEHTQVYYTNALKLFREKANESTEAQFLIGYILDPLHTNIKLSGKEKQNIDIAIREYETASKNGHKDVSFYLDNLLKHKAKK